MSDLDKKLKNGEINPYEYYGYTGIDENGEKVEAKGKYAVT
jgi:hypothetical protein